MTTLRQRLESIEANGAPPSYHEYELLSLLAAIVARLEPAPAETDWLAECEEDYANLRHCSVVQESAWVEMYAPRLIAAAKEADGLRAKLAAEYSRAYDDRLRASHAWGDMDTENVKLRADLAAANERAEKAEATLTAIRGAMG